MSIQEIKKISIEIVNEDNPGAPLDAVAVGLNSEKSDSKDDASNTIKMER